MRVTVGHPCHRTTRRPSNTPDRQAPTADYPPSSTIAAGQRRTPLVLPRPTQVLFSITTQPHPRSLSRPSLSGGCCPASSRRHRTTLCRYKPTHRPRDNAQMPSGGPPGGGQEVHRTDSSYDRSRRQPSPRKLHVSTVKTWRTSDAHIVHNDSSGRTSNHTTRSHVRRGLFASQTGSTNRSAGTRRPASTASKPAAARGPRPTGRWSTCAATSPSKVIFTGIPDSPTRRLPPGQG